MAMEVDIATVGGGLGGLVLALGLQERGLRGHVFEKAPKERKYHGTTISLGPNGLSSRMMMNGTDISKSRQQIREDGQPEKERTSLPLPGDICTIPWRSAHQTLADEIGDSSLLHWRHAFLDYTNVEGGVEARFEVPTDEGCNNSSLVHTKVVRAKMVVGVDGMKSQVWNVVVGDEPRDLLHITWNTLIRTEDVSFLNLHEKGELRFFSYRTVNSLKSGFLLDAGRGLTLWQVRTLDTSGEIKEAYAQDLEAHDRDVRKVGALRQMEGLEWLKNLREAIEGTDPDVVREARTYDCLPLTSWSDSSKRVVLLGNAAHGMYPGPGQRAQTAFEDAHQLSLLLHEAFVSLAPAESIPAAVKKYEEVRIPRTTKMQAWAAENSGLPSTIPEWVRGLSPEQQRFRFQEFSNWVKQYPEAITGDPNSTYWKP